MTEETEPADLFDLARRQRARAAHARRLSEGITDEIASEGLLTFANELEHKARDLEARAAVQRQCARETNSDAQQDIAAFMLVDQRDSAAGASS